MERKLFANHVSGKRLSGEYVLQQETVRHDGAVFLLKPGSFSPDPYTQTSKHLFDLPNMICLSSKAQRQSFFHPNIQIFFIKHSIFLLMPGSFSGLQTCLQVLKNQSIKIHVIVSFIHRQQTQITFEMHGREKI